MRRQRFVLCSLGEKLPCESNNSLEFNVRQLLLSARQYRKATPYCGILHTLDECPQGMMKHDFRPTPKQSH